MYISTRGGKERFTAAAAIKEGIAPDGGLLIPEELPKLNGDFLAELVPLDYHQRATRILQLFLPDYSVPEIKACIEAAYNAAKFDHPAVAPLVAMGHHTSVLELWHGPTGAFKDMALQLLPQLLSLALEKTEEKAEIAILVATSGDTGKAALEGFRDVKQTKIVVFFPYDGVSEIQRLQMVTQEGENVAVIAVRGNFDDAQTGVKKIFADKEFNAELQAHGVKLSSANSINWGRLLPQIVYYFSAYADLVKNARIIQGEPVNFVVPTGNFGNILAGYYAKLMGLPVNRLICASNSNNVLTDFLRSGVYDRNRNFHTTMSPSMDILISSNLERLLYSISGGDTTRVSGWMRALNDTGSYLVERETLKSIRQTFWSDWASDHETVDAIRDVFHQHKYVIDPHTAVAWLVYDKYCRETADGAQTVILSTASPFKFNHSVLTAIAGTETFSNQSEFELLRELSRITGWPVPTALAVLESKAIRHQMVCDKEEMAHLVKNAVE